MNNELIYDKHMAKAKKVISWVQNWRCTVAEVAYALSFLVNFALGKLLHVFSQEDEVYNYYNDKGNIFNQWFVKKGWGWTTLVIVVFFAIELSRRPNAKVLAAAILRYIIATFWWVLFTQWCFGHPIMDRVFLYTGGKCTSIDPDRFSRFSGGFPLVHLFQEVNGNFESRNVSSSTCRHLRGSWEGGHDPLGHVFLLVHSSLYLFHEIKPYWPGWAALVAKVRSGRQSGKNEGDRAVRVLRSAPQVAAIALLGLWWFMLLMTNMYFHLLAEKLVGLFFGYFGVAVVYYVPRWVNPQRV